MAGTQDDEVTLLRKWASGDEKAARLLYDIHNPRISRYLRAKVMPHEVDEITQQVWLSATVACRRHYSEAVTEGEAQSEPVAIKSSFRAYIIGITRHVIFAYYRRIKKDAKFDPDVDSVETLLPSLSRALSISRKAKILEIALSKLPVDLQLLAEGRYVEGLSGVELAEVFAIPEGTVRSRLAKIKATLGDALISAQGVG